MAKIKNCFMDEQPDFYFKAEIDKVNYGTMRHLTDDDFAFTRRFADRKLITDKAGNPVILVKKDEKGEEYEELQYDYDESKLLQAYLLCAFGGIEPSGNSRKLGQEGWNLDRDCTIDNIGLLKPDIKQKLYRLIIEKTNEFLSQKEAIEKN
jgi:hypothetical protein